MARASWKYHPFKSEEITNYINYITEEDFYNEAINWNSRYKTITRLNCFDYVTIYTGKFEADFRLSKYFIGCKLGQLSKTRKPYFFRSKKKKMSKKKTTYLINMKLLPQSNLKNVYKLLKVDEKFKLAHLVFLDMLNLIKMWRHIKGYPANGQTTYTNANNSKKNKQLLNFRLEQFYFLFGKKRRNIFPTLIQAEYNNRLWKKIWFNEWAQAVQFVFSLVNPKKQAIPFDPVSLAKGQTNGYVRVGNASKIGKAKKITKQCTIGLPLFFTRYIYAEILPVHFPFRLSIADDLRKKMGKKRKKNLKNKC